MSAACRRRFIREASSARKIGLRHDRRLSTKVPRGQSDAQVTRQLFRRESCDSDSAAGNKMKVGPSRNACYRI